MYAYQIAFKNPLICNTPNSTNFKTKNVLFTTSDGMLPKWAAYRLFCHFELSKGVALKMDKNRQRQLDQPTMACPSRAPQELALHLCTIGLDR